MKQFSLFTSLVLLALVSAAQEGRTPKRMTLKLAVTDSIQRVEYGYLAAMADSGIVMVKSPVVFDHSIAASNANVISYQNLSEVSIKRKGGVGKGIWIGAVSGMVLGAVVGYISYKPMNCEGATFICWDFGPGYDAAAGAALGTFAGAALGGIIGAVAKKTFVIGGRKDKFHHMKESVLDMTYKPLPKSK